MKSVAHCLGALLLLLELRLELENHGLVGAVQQEGRGAKGKGAAVVPPNKVFQKIVFARRVRVAQHLVQRLVVKLGEGERSGRQLIGLVQHAHRQSGRDNTRLISFLINKQEKPKKKSRKEKPLRARSRRGEEAAFAT